MTRNKGNFNFAANFEVLTKSPLDARQLVGTHTDLITSSTWQDGSSNVWLYNGMIVGVGSDPISSNNGAYFLCDVNNYTNSCSWVKIGRGTITGATNGLSVANNNITLGGTINDSVTFTDNRATKVGMQYGGDYSTSYTNLSLVHKGYVDAIAVGLSPRLAVKVASTANLTLNGLSTIDGVAVTDGDRVLVKNQLDLTKNGIYSASSSTWIRTVDFNFVPSGEIAQGALIPIITGSTQRNTLWVLVTPNPIISGTSSLIFTQLMNSTITQGVGILISGSTVSINGAALAGNSISWTGNTFNLNINSGSLQTALNNKLNTSIFNVFTGTTLPANYYSKLQIDNYTGETDTIIGNKLNTSLFDSFTGTTLPANYYNKSQINSYTGNTNTTISNKLNTTIFTGFTATTLPANYYNKSQINSYSAKTDTTIGNKLNITIFTGFTATTLPIINAAITGATNGLTKTNNQILLGGSISGATSIDIYTTGGTLVINDNRIIKAGIVYGGDYSTGFTANSLITRKFVEDQITTISGNTTYTLSTPAAVTVGGVAAGTVLTGKTTNQLLEEILVPALYPTLTSPSSSISLTPSGTFEVGCNIATLCLISCINRGCINPQYTSTCDKRSGLPHHYCISGAQFGSCYACTSLSMTGYATNYIISAGTATWSSYVFYDVGVQPKDSKGCNYCSPLPSGNTSLQSATLIGIYPYFWGKCTCPGGAGCSRPTATSSMVVGGTKVLASSSGSISINFSSGNDDYLWFAYPASNPTKSCWCVSALNNGSIGGGVSPACNLFPAPSVISVTTACWSGQSYNVYVSNKQTCVITSMILC